jgi:hypothetical protein
MFHIKKCLCSANSVVVVEKKGEGRRMCCNLQATKVKQIDKLMKRVFSVPKQVELDSS